MKAYNNSFDPPALTIFVRLAGVVRDRPRVEVEAIIDTGADISAVPEYLRERLKLYRFRKLLLEDARANKDTAYTYEVRVALVGESPIPMEMVLTPFPFVILGRDWLQNYYMFLNGPEQEFALGTRFKEILESLELS
jgi:hypothetical protein